MGENDAENRVALNLSELSEKVDLSDAAVKVRLEAPFHERVATDVISFFRLSLYVTLGGVLSIAGADLVFIWFGKIEAAERIVTTLVIQTMIGATVVQLGGAMAAIVYAYFKARPEAD